MSKRVVYDLAPTLKSSKTAKVLGDIMGKEVIAMNVLFCHHTYRDVKVAKLRCEQHLAARAALCATGGSPLLISQQGPVKIVPKPVRAHVTVDIDSTAAAAVLTETTLIDGRAGQAGWVAGFSGDRTLQRSVPPSGRYPNYLSRVRSSRSIRSFLRSFGQRRRRIPPGIAYRNSAGGLCPAWLVSGRRVLQATASFLRRRSRQNAKRSLQRRSWWKRHCGRSVFGRRVFVAALSSPSTAGSCHSMNRNRFGKFDSRAFDDSTNPLVARVVIGAGQGPAVGFVHRFLRKRQDRTQGRRALGFFFVGDRSVKCRVSGDRRGDPTRAWLVLPGPTRGRHSSGVFFQPSFTHSSSQAR